MNWNEIKVTGLCLNLPGPMLLNKLALKGAQVQKIEPLNGDPLNWAYPKWYRELHQNIYVHTLDLQKVYEVETLKTMLRESHLFITTARPKALKKMGLGPDSLKKINPKIFHLGLIGHNPPHENVPGHDLTYQAQEGLLPGQGLPKSLFVDFLGTEMAWSQILMALLENKNGTHWHALESAAKKLSEPLKWGATQEFGILGGATPFYQVYDTKKGKVALAALEPHFQAKICRELKLSEKVSFEELQNIFLTQHASQWEEWAHKNEIPLVSFKNFSGESYANE